MCDCLCLVNKRNGAFFIAYLGWGPTLRIVSIVTAEKTIWKAAELCVCTYTAGYLAAQCTLVMRDSTQTRPVIKEANWSASI